MSEGDLGPSVPNSPLSVGFTNIELQSKELPAPQGKRGTSHFHFELSKLLHIHGTETSKGIGCEVQPSMTGPHESLGEHPGRPEHAGAGVWRLGRGVLHPKLCSVARRRSSASDLGSSKSLLSSYVSELPLGEEAAFGIVEPYLNTCGEKSNIRMGTERL